MLLGGLETQSYQRLFFLLISAQRTLACPSLGCLQVVWLLCRQLREALGHPAAWVGASGSRCRKASRARTRRVWAAVVLQRGRRWWLGLSRRAPEIPAHNNKTLPLQPGWFSQGWGRRRHKGRESHWESKQREKKREQEQMYRFRYSNITPLSLIHQKTGSQFKD